MQQTPGHRTKLALRPALLTASLLACGSDQPCVYYPCPQPTAAVLSVSAANAPGGIAGLALSINGAAASSGFCVPDAISTCRVFGGTGTYVVLVSAPGYKTTQLNLIVTGTDAGCNTCGKIDTQNLSVIMQPAVTPARTRVRSALGVA